MLGVGIADILRTALHELQTEVTAGVRANIGLVSEVRVALFLAEAAFKERSEADGLETRPVLLGGIEQQTDFRRLKFDGFDRGEEWPPLK
jgi:hypothetical protein